MNAELLWQDEDYGPEMSVKEFIKFINLPENRDKTFELIDGYAVMMAGNASSNHQRISGYIFNKIYNHLAGKKCEVFQDLNIYLFKKSFGKCKNVYQPDILVGCDKDKMTDKGYEGTPEFIVEVVSKSTAGNDYFVKSKIYMEFGVKEYWIADLLKKQIVVFINDDNKDRPDVYKYKFTDEITIGIFGDLNIDFNEILKIVT